MVAIIDYDAGNIKSVQKAIEYLGEDVIISRDPEVILNASRVILPGVGAFGTAMENIEPYKDLIFEHIDDGKPFLGICLGLQVLLSSSEESPGVKGLDIFKGHVAKIPEGRKIPHMGWNQLKQVKEFPILDGVDGKDFYFVHSYHAVLDDTENLSATADYGFDVTAAVSKDNVFATQFHPEKSGVPGLKILKNFVSLE